MNISFYTKFNFIVAIKVYSKLNETCYHASQLEICHFNKNAFSHFIIIFLNNYSNIFYMKRVTLLILSNRLVQNMMQMIIILIYLLLLFLYQNEQKKTFSVFVVFDTLLKFLCNRLLGEYARGIFILSFQVIPREKQKEYDKS